MEEGCYNTYRKMHQLIPLPLRGEHYTIGAAVTPSVFLRLLALAQSRQSQKDGSVNGPIHTTTHSLQLSHPFLPSHQTSSLPHTTPAPRPGRRDPYAQIYVENTPVRR